ncbi:hypothetical protein HBHAL_4172 [Halobacillus halophilus DSM 2266]|uniref:Uncharacterized protein n=1 Tax=Halobacillus halophilus (strain ATCC 35676 / DSM 2266 / JCM 20832 / KCTC 3685 / LMG 17431 / NBRC 102448 / NCIMB 2269) TaxID=866895 RepID=I0JQU4_HALH3|nr:hypothetical protein HBHAL_4172 [Halobacillus halophilus DSM 2266]
MDDLRWKVLDYLIKFHFYLLNVLEFDRILVGWL